MRRVRKPVLLRRRGPPRRRRARREAARRGLHRRHHFARQVSAPRLRRRDEPVHRLPRGDDPPRRRDDGRGGARLRRHRRGARTAADEPERAVAPDGREGVGAEGAAGAPAEREAAGADHPRAGGQARPQAAARHLGPLPRAADRARRGVRHRRLSEPRRRVQAHRGGVLAADRRPDAPRGARRPRPRGDAQVRAPVSPGWRQPGGARTRPRRKRVPRGFPV